MNRQTLATFGENKAEEYLKAQGYVILTRNFKCKIGEIDLVALDKDTLVFVEVKTRYEKDQIKPEYYITKRKLYLIEKTGEYYKQNHCQLPDLLRIDAVLIELNQSDQVVRMELIKNVSL